jgi:hypothetical protein
MQIVELSQQKSSKEENPELLGSAEVFERRKSRTSRIKSSVSFFLKPCTCRTAQSLDTHTKKKRSRTELIKT